MKQDSFPPILVADRDIGLKRELVRVLQKSFRVYQAHGGKETLGLLRSLPVRLLVLNADLTVVPGVPLVDIIRARCPGVHVIAYTAESSPPFSSFTRYRGEAASPPAEIRIRMLIAPVLARRRKKLLRPPYIDTVAYFAGHFPSVTSLPHFKCYRN